VAAIEESGPRARRWKRIVSGMAYRPLRVVALLLAVVFVSACQSTTVDGLRIRAQPTTASPIMGSMGIAGASVIPDCFIRGEAIHGNTTWYRISEPRRGYVSGYYVSADDSQTTTHYC
jgi:hypothetical protein